MKPCPLCSTRLSAPFCDHIPDAPFRLAAQAVIDRGENSDEALAAQKLSDEWDAAIADILAEAF